MTYKIMPEMPTEDMLLAGSDAQHDKDGVRFWETPLQIYNAMYAVAPSVESEPILYAVKDWKNCLEIFNGQTSCSGKKTDLHEIPLYATSQDQSAKIAELEKIIAECWQVFGKEIPKKYKEKIAELEVNNKFLEERLESDNKKIVELLIKVAEWEKLKDPNTLYVNLLRGFPATLPKEQLNHLNGNGNEVLENQDLSREVADNLQPYDNTTSPCMTKCDTASAFGVTYYLTAEDSRYPTLVLQGEFGSVGYNLNLNDGSLRRICLCHAHGVNECLCGAWDV
jgi:hypothetical protein